MSDNQILGLKKEFSGCPDDCWSFLYEVGCGKVKEPDESDNSPPHFECLERLPSAERECYQDKRIYDGGAQGDIFLFGFEGTGTAFGFDAGDGFHLVKVDNCRIVKRLDMSFKAFALGLLVCSPDFPGKYESEKWFNDLGDEFLLIDRMA